MGWLMRFSPNLTAFLVGWVRLFVFEIFEHFFLGPSQFRTSEECALSFDVSVSLTRSDNTIFLSAKYVKGVGARVAIAFTWSMAIYG